MRPFVLSAPALLAAVVGGCSSVEGNPHAGDSNYAWNYTPIPGAPTMDSVIPGDRQITVYFAGSGAGYYIAVCSIVAGGGGRNGFTYKSPAAVDSLINGVEYRCAVTAFNSGRPSASSSAALNATPKAP